MKIAVVIPTLDEEAVITRTLEAVRVSGRPAVVVVADCGSADRTVADATSARAVVVSGPDLDSRAAAMNAGAARALELCPDADAILFLHADAVPAARWDAHVARALADPGVVGGAFDFVWDLSGVGWLERVPLLVISSSNRVRMRLTRAFYGDQGIFVRASAWRAIGGVPRMTLLEDFHLCRRLRRVGRLRVARGRTVISPRRFLRHGVVRQALIDAVLLVAYGLGLEPVRLHAWYNREGK